MSRNASLVARTVSHLAGGAAESSAVAWAETLAKDFEALLSASESNEAALLSAIGMAKHERLVSLRSRILNENSSQNGVQTLKTLEERLKKERFVSAGSTEPTIADAILAWSAREVVDYVLEPSDRVYEYPSSNRWLETCLSHDAFKRAYKEELVHMGVLDSDGPCRVIRGQLREGNMIDAKPVSTDARRAAEVVKALNADYKKKQTQRQKEKAVTETSIPAAQAGLVLEFSLGDKISSSDEAKIEKCMKMVLASTKLEAIEKVEHPPAMDAKNLSEALASKPGIKCKNLFLAAKKPKNETDSGIYLVCCPIERAVDIRFLENQLGYKKDQLRFASQETLSKALDVVQGNVTPFALVNDPSLTVNVVLDDEMVKDKDVLLWFHPLDNTASLGIPAAKLVDFVKASGRIPMILSLTNKDGGAAAKSVGKEEVSSSKKSDARGGEGAPIPTKKPAPAVAPVNTASSGEKPPSKKVEAAMATSSLISPPKTLEEALEREETALKLVQERQSVLDAAKEALEKVKAEGGDATAAEKAFKLANRAKKEADMIYGNAAGFTEKIRSSAVADGGQKANQGAPDATSTSAPLVFTLTHELAQDRLWARLDKLLSARPHRLEGEQDLTATRPKGHNTHNLLVKDSKSKKLYLVCMRQDRDVDLKTLGEKLSCQGGLRLAGPADIETAIALTRGCITPLSLYNNPQGTVTPVFDSALMAEADKQLVICAGCDNAHDHANHNCVEISVNQMLQLIQEGAKREHIVVDL